MRHFLIAATLVVAALVFTGLAGALQSSQQRPRLVEDATPLESAQAHDPVGASRR